MVDVQEILPHFAWWMCKKSCLILYGGCTGNLALFCMLMFFCKTEKKWLAGILSIGHLKVSRLYAY